MPVHAGKDDGVRADVKRFHKALLRPLELCSAFRDTTLELSASLLQLFLVMYQLSDVLGMPQDIGWLPSLLIADIVIGPHPFLAVFHEDAHQTTVSGLVADPLQIGREHGPCRGYQKQAELLPNSLMWLIAQRACGCGVDKEQHTIKVMQADEPLAVFNDMTIPGVVPCSSVGRGGRWRQCSF